MPPEDVTPTDDQGNNDGTADQGGSPGNGAAADPNVSPGNGAGEGGSPAPDDGGSTNTGTGNDQPSSPARDAMVKRFRAKTSEQGRTIKTLEERIAQQDAELSTLRTAPAAPAASAAPPNNPSPDNSNAVRQPRQNRANQDDAGNGNAAPATDPNTDRILGEVVKWIDEVDQKVDGVNQDFSKHTESVQTQARVTKMQEMGASPEEASAFVDQITNGTFEERMEATTAFAEIAKEQGEKQQGRDDARKAQLNNMAAATGAAGAASQDGGANQGVTAESVVAKIKDAPADQITDELDKVFTQHGNAFGNAVVEQLTSDLNPS